MSAMFASRACRSAIMIGKRQDSHVWVGGWVGGWVGVQHAHVRTRTHAFAREIHPFIHRTCTQHTYTSLKSLYKVASSISECNVGSLSKKEMRQVVDHMGTMEQVFDISL